MLLTPERPVPDTLGGKGGALARLVVDGYPVPATGVITTGAYRSVAGQPVIADLVARIGAGEEPSPDDVDATFAKLVISEPLRGEIIELARAVGEGGLVAVRSSATVEDLHGSSFAGQYRSLLNIDAGIPEVILAAVRQVWASLWHPAPSAYRRAFGIDDSDVAMAVVVMRMIPATTAGVVFTDDPGGSGGARVEAVEGLGESLVSGQRTPVAWEVGDADGQVDPANLPAVPARALELAHDIAAAAGTPQDVEWAAVDDEVYVVQARPITVLESDDGFDTPVDDHELTTAGIVEMVPGVLPPLRWEVNRFLLEEAFRSILASLGVIRGRAVEDRPFVRRVRGRVAIDFDQLREAAGGIPGAVEELEQQYFGQTSEGEGEGEKHHAHGFGFSDLARDLRTLQTRRQVIEQAEVLIGATTALRQRRPSLDEQTEVQLLAYGRRLVDLGARGLAAELGVAASGAAAYRRLELQLGRHLGSEQGVAETQALVGRTGATTARQALASAAIFAGPTWSEMASGPPSSSESAVGYSPEEEWHRVRDRLKALPGWTRRRILTGGFVDFRSHLINRLRTDVIEQIQRREKAKVAVLELGGELRRVHLELGRRLVDGGLLERADEIELLASAEVLAAVDSGANGGLGASRSASIGERASIISPDVVRRRRNWLSRYQAEGNLPLRFVGIPDREPEPLPEGDVLEGWAASPGRRRGLARVVTSATGRLDPGEVLVAEATDASWSPLFMRAGAVVVERGGPLSHAAILARELGLPAVLNVSGAARILDRCTVSVDGDQGIVVIESRGEQP
ncbi:MAG: hypothetical protein GY929_20655 [Actinomycetia bacterium]|nr:hypothetical protein [Actinomycetes bacterium]